MEGDDLPGGTLEDELLDLLELEELELELRGEGEELNELRGEGDKESDLRGEREEDLLSIDLSEAMLEAAEFDEEGELKEEDAKDLAVLEVILCKDAETAPESRMLEEAENALAALKEGDVIIEDKSNLGNPFAGDRSASIGLLSAAWKRSSVSKPRLIISSFSAIMSEVSKPAAS